MNKFIYMCAMCGLCDTLYKKENRPPKWMDETEQRAWHIGAKYAKNFI